MKRKLDKEIVGEKKDSNTNDNRVATALDFGDEAVKNWETKLQILKFSYSWADQVEKEEKAAIQEAKAAEETVHKEENKTQHISIGGILTKQQKNSPRMKLAACVRRIKAKELAKVLIEKQNIKKVETAESTKQRDPRDTKKTLDLGAVGDKKEKSDACESEASVKPVVQDGEVCGQSLVGILDTQVDVLRNPFPNTSVDMSSVCIARTSEDKKITSLQEEQECIDIHVPEAMELEVNKDQKISLKLLNKDDDSYCDDDDDDDDDSLFGPRKLFFFGIDYFKDAGKTGWRREA
ncbi:uncharacterized protein LOC133192892 [Saccostrea echinata]|uniref:uncharacterized protein LOC133192892 n=1 Tax=Saccostrea echinata TaxID=191078 RepID=UPI002A7F2024|nr:uncharacterized protein LOC133192892 [Saccostrea echinata]